MPAAFRPAAVLFLLALLLLPCACGQDDPPEQAAPKPREPVYENLLSRVAQTGKLVAGVAGNLPPFGFRAEPGAEPEGFEVDLVKALAAEMGVDLKIVVLLPSERLPAVTSGRVDLAAAGLEHTFPREDAVDFSTPVFMDGQKVLVHKGSGIAGIGGLTGRPVAAAKGAGDAARLHEANPESELRIYKDYVEAFLALKRGDAQALTADATVLLRLRSADVEPDLWRVVGPYLSRKPYALALPENQSDFRDAVNKALARLWLSGEFQRIYEKWFGPETDHPLPLDFEVSAWPGADDK